MGMMVVVVRGVMDMEVDKVADMMVEMEVDKGTEMVVMNVTKGAKMLAKKPTEDFTGVQGSIK